MPYDEKLCTRIRKVLAGQAGVSEKKMFGGVAYLLEGSMFCGIAKNDLMVRVGPDRYEEALARPHVRPMDFTGRPLKGYVFVEPAGCKTDASLTRWIKQGADFVATLPPKRRARAAKGSTR